MIGSTGWIAGTSYERRKARYPPRPVKREKTVAFGGDSVYRSGAPEEIRTPDPQIRSLLLTRR